MGIERRMKVGDTSETCECFNMYLNSRLPYFTQGDMAEELAQSIDVKRGDVAIADIFAEYEAQRKEGCKRRGSRKQYLLSTSGEGVALATDTTPFRAMKLSCGHGDRRRNVTMMPVPPLHC